MGQPVHILVLGNESAIIERCREVLATEGYSVDRAQDGPEGLEKMRRRSYNLVVLGPGVAKGFDAEEAVDIDPLAAFIAIDGPDATEGAVETLGHDIFERVPESFAADHLLSGVRRGLEVRDLRVQVKTLTAESEEIRRDIFRFITTVAHELRAPLAAIESYLSAYLSNAAGPDQEQNLRMLQRARVRSHALIDLVGDLLEFMRLESGGGPPRKMVSIDLMEIIGDTVELFRRQGEERLITINVEAPDHLPRIEAHPSEMEQLFANLISNAIKYNKDAGDVTVRAEEEHGFLRIIVADTGIGIGKDDLPHIFDEFYRISKPETRYTTGTGLGLAIVRKIVESHSGAIRVESKVGEGTAFIVELPVHQGD